MENNIKIERKGERLISFLKKYGYFMAAGVVIAAITLTVLLTSLKAPIKEVEDTIPSGSDALVFNLPLLDCSILHDFSIDKLVFNSTLGWLETHSGIDLASTTSDDVFAACAGTVTSIYKNSLEGTVVVIKHDDEFSTLYGSLSADTLVDIGDTVTAGQKIGTISSSAGNESLLGAHLHFEILKENSNVNPNDYLNLENK